MSNIVNASRWSDDDGLELEISDKDIDWMDLDEVDDIREIWFILRDDNRYRSGYQIERVVFERDFDGDPNTPYNKFINIFKDTLSKIIVNRKQESEEREYENYLKLKAKFEGE
jgi:hypothetical protein